MDSLAPIPFRLLIDRVVPLIKPHFLAAFPITAAPLALANVTMVFLQYRMMGSLVDAADPAVMLSYMGGFFASFFFMIAVFTLTYCALAIAAMEVVDGGPGRIQMGRAWRLMLSPKAFGTLLLWTVAGMVSLILCVAPALVVMPLLALTLNVMVAEERYGMDALKRSASLVWWSPTGRPIDSTFLRVAGLFFVGWGVQSGIGMVVQGPVAALQQYYVLRDAAGGVATDPTAAMGPLWLLVTGQFFGALASTVAWFYWAFGFALLYREIRRRREAPDLREAILELTEAPSDEAAPYAPAPT